MSSTNTTIDLGFDLDSILGKNKNKTSFHYLEDGIAIYKILPALDPNNRQLFAEHNFHWAKGSNDKNMKVQCTYYTEKYCPFCNAHKELEKMYKAAEASEPEGSEVIKRLAKAMQEVQKTKNFYYNAVTPENEVVVLQLSKTVSDLLNKKLAEAVQQKNQDPTAMKAGYWFAFNKQGKGRDSVTVDFHRTAKIVDGDEVEVLNRTALPDALIETLPTKAASIHNKRKMYVMEYTGAELAGYLKGTPLKDKFKEEQAKREAEKNKASEAPAETKAETTAATPTTQASAPAETSAPASAQDGFAAEAARLRALALGTKTN